MHRLLKRQIKKILGEEYTQDSKLQNIFQLISDHYIDKDKDCVLLANALEVNSAELTELNMQLQNMAFYDSLTGLTNRALFEKELELTIKQINRHKRNIALVFFDLDNFKNVNDTFGHDVGDKLLIEVGKIIQENIRSCDTLSRWAGDEFVLLLDELKHMDDSVLIVQNIQKKMKHPIKIGTHTLHVSCSVGINVYEDAQDVHQMLKNADIAMYEAKKNGKRNYAIYTSVLGEKIISDVQLNEELLQALKRDEFIVYYQPQVEILTGKIVGAEALVRWEHPEKGILFPLKFIPFAEEKGYIVKIGQRVLEQACKDMQKWLNNGYKLNNISVNISVKQIRQNNFVQVVKKALKKSGLPADMLEFEVTETMIMQEYKHSFDVLDTLRKLGISLSIDDFGTGYSSLSYLKKLPIDKIKIDKSFIDEIAEDENDVAITKAIIAMSHSLGLSVLAEGVETKSQLQVLKKLKCEKYQGYYCSRPIPAKEFEKLLHQQVKEENDKLFDLTFEI